MSEDERGSVLKMVAEGKITADEALKLIQALEEGEEDETSPEVEAVPTVSDVESSRPDPELEKRIGRYRGLWLLPLTAGLLLTVLGAYWMYSAMINSGFGFWFLISWLPFLIGVAITAFAVESKTSKWVYVNVNQKTNDWPRHIVVAFPIPTGILRWSMKNFGHNIPFEYREQADDALKMILEDGTFSDPLVVDVDDESATVQVYIG
jgi:hypothetical protein